MPMESKSDRLSQLFIPTSREEMQARGWNELDVLFISGDAYVDHPSFGIPLLARLLESKGYRVGIIAQPEYRDAQKIAAAFKKLGTPRLFVGISAGTVDSMLNHYTANKKPRSDDMYSPGGRAHFRPDDATITYTRLAREVFGEIPIIIGGVEASLRRLTHFDYWKNKLRPSILIESGADLLVHGMAERQILAIADALKSGSSISALHAERGVAFVLDKEHYILRDNQLKKEGIPHELRLPAYEELKDDRKKFAKMTWLALQESNALNAKALIQKHGSKFVVITPPALPLSTEELDSIYSLPYQKTAHYSYQEKIPADEMIRFSITVNRGCPGGCTFCAITQHQGRAIQSRSEKSVLEEITRLSRVQGYKGNVSDLGGPTANAYGLCCTKPDLQKVCKKTSCLWPNICKHLKTDHSAQIALLQKARKLPGVKRVFIASGVRFDLALKDPAYIRELVQHHVGGHLKVAPEHSHPEVLGLMHKPGFNAFCEFERYFEQFSKEVNKEQYIVPYFISGFPGTTDQMMLELQGWLKKRGWKLQQVQGFIPTPMTLATAMYYSGIDPATKKPLHVAKDAYEKKMQQAILQPHRPENRKKVMNYLSKTKTPRTDRSRGKG